MTLNVAGRLLMFALALSASFILIPWVLTAPSGDLEWRLGGGLFLLLAFIVIAMVGLRSEGVRSWIARGTTAGFAALILSVILVGALCGPIAD